MYFLFFNQCHLPFFVIFADEMDLFQFKQFTIQQNRCAMKVGTDGVLLGAWVDGGNRILDIGTGTGLVALMMAQRFPTAQVTAVEMDGDACRQAEENGAKSPFCERLTFYCDTIQHFSIGCEKNQCFDSIVCNPPFFENSLKNNNPKTTLARHNDHLPWEELVDCVDALITDEGVFSVILPKEAYVRVTEMFYLKGFKECRSCKILTKENKPCKRILAAYTKNLTRPSHAEQQVLMNNDGTRSEWYGAITKDFYIR